MDLDVLTLDPHILRPLRSPVVLLLPVDSRLLFKCAYLLPLLICDGSVALVLWTPHRRRLFMVEPIVTCVTVR